MPGGHALPLLMVQHRAASQLIGPIGLMRQSGSSRTQPCKLKECFCPALDCLGRRQGCCTSGRQAEGTRKLPDPSASRASFTTNSPIRVTQQSSLASVMQYCSPSRPPCLARPQQASTRGCRPVKQAEENNKCAVTAALAVATVPPEAQPESSAVTVWGLVSRS